MGEWRRRAKDGGVEKESEGWGSGDGERRMGEWRRKAKDGIVEKESEGWGSGDDSETGGRRRKRKSATSGGARLSRTSGIKDSNNY